MSEAEVRQQSSSTTDSIDLTSLTVAHLGGANYVVFNKGSGKVYKTNIQHQTCNCKDKAYNRDSGEACKHIQKAIVVHPSEWSIEDSLLDYALDSVSELNNIRDEFDKLRELIVDEIDRASSTEAPDTPVVDAEEVAGAKDYDANEQAEKLREALEQVGVPIKTIVQGNKIWINTVEQISKGKFAAFIQNPSAMQYDPDNKPQDYYKNYITSRDVDSYVSEVA